jgi:putative transposase
MRPLSYAGYRFPPEIIQHAIWLYLRFTLSFRDVEELLAERGIDVSYETIRRWVAVFGPVIARRLRAMRPKPNTDEMFVLSLPKTISARSDDAGQTEWA